MTLFLEQSSYLLKKYPHEDVEIGKIDVTAVFSSGS